MAIIYYPNRIYKGKVPAIDREMAKRNPLQTDGSKNITAEALDVTISPFNEAWQINSVLVDFQNTNVRDWTASIKNGRKVVEDLNDSLWFQITSSNPQNIHLDEGFYTGSQLAAELQTQLDANVSFTALGITFTVAYANATGLFTITPSSGQIRYLDVNTAQTLRTRDSIAGHLFGLTATAAFASTSVSDTAVFALNKEAAFITETADADLERYSDTVHPLTIDQALHLVSNTANTVMDYTITYEEIV